MVVPSRRISSRSPAQRRGLRGVHAGRRLVEGEELRLGGERARDLEPALVAVREVARERVGALRDTDVVEQLVGALGDRLLLHSRLRIAEDRAEHVRAGAHVAPDHHVLQRRQVREQADVLKRSRDAARGDFVRLQIGHWLAVEHEFAGVLPVDPGQHVEEARLARAVGPDEAVDFAVPDVEAHVGERVHAAEPLADPFCHEEREVMLAHCVLVVSSSRLRSADGRMPAGRNSIISTSASPNSSIRITSGSISIRPNSCSCTGWTV